MTSTCDVTEVEEAYYSSLKKQVDNFFCNCVDGNANAETVFLEGLAVLRKARDRAIELVQVVQ